MGRTNSSLGRLSKKLHPLHKCELMRIKPYTRRAKHKSVKPKSTKPKEAKETAEGGDSITAQEDLIEHEERVRFECVLPHDIGTSEQLAADAVGFEDDPEEEDYFGLCGL